MNDGFGEEGIVNQEELTLQERIERDIANTPPGKFAVVCIPMQTTSLPCPRTVYMNNREEALTYAQEQATRAAEYTSSGKISVVSDAFNFRRFGVYDDKGPLSKYT